MTWVWTDSMFLCVVQISEGHSLGLRSIHRNQSWQTLDTYHASLSVIAYACYTEPTADVVHSTAAKQENIVQGNKRSFALFQKENFQNAEKMFPANS